MILSLNLLGQQEIIKAYADSLSMKKYCFYPSTLRMLNLSGNKDYYEMIEDIEKLLVYSLDSTSIEQKSYIKLLKSYSDAGFDEFAILNSRSGEFIIYGRNEKCSELTGVIRNKEKVFAFYLIGAIGFHKIPLLISEFDNGNILNIFDIDPINAK